MQPKQLEQQPASQDMMEIDQTDPISGTVHHHNNTASSIWYRLVDENGNYLGDSSRVSVDAIGDVVDVLEKVKNKEKQDIPEAMSESKLKVYGSSEIVSDIKELLKSDPVKKGKKVKALLGEGVGIDDDHPLIIQVPISVGIRSLNRIGNVGMEFNVQKNRNRTVRHQPFEGSVTFPQDMNFLPVQITADQSITSLEQLRDLVYEHCHIQGVLYEEKIDKTGNRVPLRLDKLPETHGNLLWFRERRTPPSSTMNLEEDMKKFSVHFPDLFELTQEFVQSLDESIYDSMGRVSFVDADRYISSSILQDDAPLIPVFFDQEKNISDIQFTYLRQETREQKQVLEMLKQFPIIFLRGASGCGKTTTMMAIGMQHRSMYIEMTPDSWDYIGDSSSNDLSERHEILRNRIRVWIFARLCLILYLEETYKLVPADLIAAQRSSYFNRAVRRLYAKIMKWNTKSIDELLFNVNTMFPTVVMLDECHMFQLNHKITNETLGITNETLGIEIEAKHVLSSLSYLWWCLKTVEFKFLLATTHLQTSIESAIISCVGKTGLEVTRVKYEFNEFTFHETPKLLKSYVRDFPDSLCESIAGRARFGSNVLLCIIERSSLVDRYRDLYDFYFSCVEIVCSFHSKGALVSGSKYFHDAATSLYARLSKYLNSSSGIRTDHAGSNLSLHEALVTLMLARHIPHTGKEYANVLDSSQKKYIEVGVGFLEQGEVTLREPFAMGAVSTIITVEEIMIRFKKMLETNRIIFTSKDPIKGIVFQWLIQVTLFSLKGKKLGDVLSLWTGESIETLLQKYDWLKDVVQDRFQCERIVYETDAERIFEKLDGKTLVIVPNNARCEFLYKLPGSKVIITAGVKLLSQGSDSALVKNESAATLAKMFVSHDGIILNQEKRGITLNYFLRNDIINIGLIVTMADVSVDTRYVVTDQVIQIGKVMPSMFVYFDKDTIPLLLRDERILSSLERFYDDSVG